MRNAGIIKSLAEAGTHLAWLIPRGPRLPPFNNHTCSSDFSSALHVSFFSSPFIDVGFLFWWQAWKSDDWMSCCVKTCRVLSIFSTKQWKVGIYLCALPLFASWSVNFCELLLILSWVYVQKYSLLCLLHLSHYTALRKHDYPLDSSTIETFIALIWTAGASR